MLEESAGAIETTGTSVMREILSKAHTRLTMPDTIVRRNLKRRRGSGSQPNAFMRPLKRKSSDKLMKWWVANGHNRCLLKSCIHISIVTKVAAEMARVRATATTTQFATNCKIELRSLVVDVGSDLTFDIFKYFGLELPRSLIEDWDSDSAFPFTCEVECVVTSDNRPITCPVTLMSEQYSVTHPVFPNVSILHNISREQHCFVWDKCIELPISYRELPIDSVANFKFYACVFQTPPKLIGATSVRLFTRRGHRLRSGPFTLTFDNTPETRLQKHVRRLATGKTRTYYFVDDQLRCVSDSLHPTDADRFFKALMHPFEPMNLSKSSQFVRINVCSPASDPCQIVNHRDFVLNSLEVQGALNPCQRLYHDLAHSQGPAKSALLKDSNVTETLNKIKAMPPLAELPLVMKNTVYNNYMHCLWDPALMPALFRSVNWKDSEEAANISAQLESCKPVDVEYALEFFTKRYKQRPVRKFAVRCISSVDRDELLLYIPQLLQAVKQEYTDGLPEILIKHACDDIVFASHLYWLASIEAKDDEKIGELMGKLMETIPPEFQESLKAQTQLIESIQALLDKAHAGKPSTTQIRDRVRDLLTNDPEHSSLQRFEPVRMPLDPTRFVVGINPNDIKVFQSKLRPVLLSFILQDGSRYRVIFKTGDDMRQDQLIIQLFEVMDRIFQKASLHLPITAYKTLAFSSSFGCCEFVENSKAIRDIITEKKPNHTIRDYLEEDHQNIDAKIERFTASLAAYCVMTYVLKIGDRHDNNILVTRDGRLLHIDYGYILGDVTKPFTPPLKLSSEMVETIGSNGLQKICGWAGPAFNSLRKRARLILVLIELMFTAPLSCFHQNPMRRLQQVENSLLLNCTEIEAMNSLQATFSESLNSKMQMIWDAVHGIAVSANGPSAET